MTWRVLHIDSGRDWRGGQRQVFLLARGMRAHGHEPLVVSPPGSPLLARLRAAGLANTAVRMRGEWDLVAVRRIRTLMRTWKPDIVHAHDARSHMLALAALMGRDIPLVVTRRVPFPPKGIRFKYGARVARFIAISGAVRDAMSNAGVESDRIALVYSGVVPPTVGARRDWRTECGWPADAVLCGVVGAMTAEKGVLTLEEVARAMPADVRARVRLVLLGGHASGHEKIGGIDAYRAGFVDEIHDAMAGLDVLWHPSSAEGLGTAVIDAMWLGVPPVAFAVGGLRELVESNVNGLLAPPGDIAAFAEHAAQLVRDPALRARLAKSAAERAQHFDAEHMITGTERVYADLLRDTPEPERPRRGMVSRVARGDEAV